MRLSFAAGVLFVSAYALNNNLGRTPQMGYNSWYDVGMSPSADLVTNTAAAMASNGLQAAGYIYVNLDDGIVQTTRDASGNLIADPKFPGGFPPVADMLHAKGFKFGVYTVCNVCFYPRVVEPSPL